MHPEGSLSSTNGSRHWLSPIATSPPLGRQAGGNAAEKWGSGCRASIDLLRSAAIQVTCRGDGTRVAERLFSSIFPKIFRGRRIGRRRLMLATWARPASLCPPPTPKRTHNHRPPPSPRPTASLSSHWTQTITRILLYFPQEWRCAHFLNKKRFSFYNQQNEEDEEGKKMS